MRNEGNQFRAVQPGETARAARARRQPDQHGFTLIELLVVIVILGILSAVVVFAVRGAGDKGRDAADATDERSIRTAQEAYCAKAGQYGNGKQLAGLEPAADGQAYKFLSEEPIRAVTAENRNPPHPGPPGPCNGWIYTIAPIGDIETGQGPPPLTCGQPGGWCVTNALLGPFFEDIVQLESGKVFTMIDDIRRGPPVLVQQSVALYDPIEGQWSDGPNIDVNSPGTGHVQLLSDDPTTEVSECASADRSIDNCGKVLVLAGGSFSRNIFKNNFGTWWLYDPKIGPAGSFEKLDVPHHPRYDYGTSSVQITGSDCGARCGNILITGEVQGGGSDRTQNIPFAELFDPKTNKFSLTDSSYAPLDGFYMRMAPLRDGRVLMINHFRGINEVRLSLAKLFNPMTGLISDASPPGFFISGFSGGFGANRLTVLNDGTVLAVGESAAGIYTADPKPEGLGSWKSVPSCASSDQGCFVLASLADGSVLANRSSRFGRGFSEENFTFNRESESWTPTGMLNDPRSARQGVLLDGKRGGCGTNCNKVLAVGKYTIPPENNVEVPVAELYCGPQAASC